MKTLALLIDGDNAQLNYTKQIIEFCEVFGTLKIKNAYGDWEQRNLSVQRQKITELHISFIQQNRVAKNATDFRLAMDVAVMLEKREVDIYFIVSSDGHFTAMCDQIHQKGAKVIGIEGNGNASSELRKGCDIFFDLEEIVKNQTKLSTKSSTVSKPKIVTKAKPKPPIILKTSDKPSTEAANVPILKTPAMFKLLSKPAAKVAAPKTKLETKPKVEVKPKAEPKVVAKLKPEATSKPKATPKVKVAIKPNPQPNQAAMLEILINTYKKAPQKEGWVYFAQLGDVRSQLKQKFGTGFATKPLSTWFKTFPHKFEVMSDRVRMK